jgi:hypothetical protein
VISSQERRIWQDVEGCHTPGIEEPAPPGPHQPRLEGRGPDHLPAAIVSGIWAAVVLTLFGFVLAGLAIGLVTTLGALSWRYWPLLRG